MRALEGIWGCLLSFQGLWPETKAHPGLDLRNSNASHATCKAQTSLVLRFGAPNPRSSGTVRDEIAESLQPVGGKPLNRSEWRTLRVTTRLPPSLAPRKF